MNTHPHTTPSCLSNYYARPINLNLKPQNKPHNVHYAQTISEPHLPYKTGLHVDVCTCKFQALSVYSTQQVLGNKTMVLLQLVLFQSLYTFMNMFEKGINIIAHIHPSLSPNETTLLANTCTQLKAEKGCQL